MKNPRLLVALGLALALALGMALAVQAQDAKPEAGIDKKLCAEKIRFGSEAFNRQEYRAAKAYFRQAVQADPASAKAWAFYDLCVMYDVAEQVRAAGQVKVSDGPKPGCPQVAAGATAPAAAAASPAAEQKAPAPAATAPAIPVIPPDEGC